MNTQSVFLARVIGPVLVCVALGVLLKRLDYKDIVDGFFKNAGARYTAALAAMVLGLIIVNTHNLWNFHWAIIITFLGWSGVIKGICLLFVPEKLEALARKCVENEKYLQAKVIGTLVAGGILVCMGYF